MRPERMARSSAVSAGPHEGATLVLFDIDGTLLLSQRAGAIAMMEAARRLHGRDIVTEGLEFAGCLDNQIWASLAARNRIPAADARHAQFRSLYAILLKELLDSRAMARALPGVLPLLAGLAADARFTVGLLTGNYPETGRMKLQAAGIDPKIFPVAAWGDDGQVRRDLPRVAMRRYQELRGRPAEPCRIVIVGDTPHDIDCARAAGCRALAVATGPSYSLDALLSHKPDIAFSDLTDTDEVLSWLRGV